MTRKPQFRATGVAAGLCLALAAAGCGGDEDKGLSKAELVSQGNAICKRHGEKITAAASKVLAGGSLPSPAVFGKLANETIIPEYTAQISELSALEPGSEQASGYKAWLARSRATSAQMKRNPRIITNPASFQRVNGEARALGFSSDCNVGPG